MRWKDLRRSKNVEDTRGTRGTRAGGMKLSGGMIIIAIIVSLVTGQNPLSLLQMLGGAGGNGSTVQTPQASNPAADDEASQFVSAVLGSTEDVWSRVFRSSGQQYQAPRLRIFENAVASACGYNSAAVGPFYCPGDRKVYLDLSFFRQLAQMGAPGDFAQAYVIGHEVGHHIQNITGIEPRVRRLQQSGNKSQANQLSVLMELQADCLAGVWAYHANQANRVLEPGDVQEGIRAAATIGDDALQSSSGKSVRPESFTHGSSAQRVEWLKLGLSGGNVDSCDTFAKAGVRL
ncbi:MAG: neutral zinc metallopeptidase [Lysobacterales bacterium]